MTFSITRPQCLILIETKLNLFPLRKRLIFLPSRFAVWNNFGRINLLTHKGSVVGRYEILDTGPEQEFDDITLLYSSTFLWGQHPIDRPWQFHSLSCLYGLH